MFDAYFFPFLLIYSTFNLIIFHRMFYKGYKWALAHKQNNALLFRLRIYRYIFEYVKLS